MSTRSKDGGSVVKVKLNATESWSLYITVSCQRFNMGACAGRSKFIRKNIDE